MDMVTDTNTLLTYKTVSILVNVAMTIIMLKILEEISLMLNVANMKTLL